MMRMGFLFAIEISLIISCREKMAIVSFAADEHFSASKVIVADIGILENTPQGGMENTYKTSQKKHKEKLYSQ